MSNISETRKDSVDFRDRIYQPALVPLERARYPNPALLHVRNQGTEGSCTGFSLASVIDYLGAARATQEQGSFPPVSARMLYEMAKQHDRWPGDSYEGSSIRGAMKGWHKNGVCTEKAWKYAANNPGHLTDTRRTEARQCPLGAYYRVLPKRSDLQAALHEVPAICASAMIHSGWSTPLEGGIIDYKSGDPTFRKIGGHAFAILGYTQDGFIVQNSWGLDWAGLDLDGEVRGGLALWRYDDFEDNLWDAWAARMALPVNSLSELVSGRFEALPGGTQRVERAPPRESIAHHYIHIDDGQFDPQGDYPSVLGEVKQTIEKAFDGRADHVLLYAHGGLNRVKGSATRAGRWREVFEGNKIHEIHLIWETGIVAELRDILLGKNDFAERRAAGVSDWTDRWLERLTRTVGHALWKEMRSDAEIAFRETLHGTHRTPAGTTTLRLIHDAFQSASDADRPKLHLVGHSAGAILMSHLLARWEALGGQAVDSLILFAPACTHELVGSHIAPALGRQNGGVKSLHHFLLTDEAEQDDHVARVYRKSLLYLVSRAYQRKTGDPVPLMGMAKHESALNDILSGLPFQAHHAPDQSDTTDSTSHGGFDNDPATMNAMLSIVLGRPPGRPFNKSDLEGY